MGVRGAGAVLECTAQRVGRESTRKSSRARRRRQLRAANPCYASRAERHCNFRNHCICTAREDRSSLVGPNFAERSHRCVYGLLLSVSKNTQRKPRNAGTAEIPSLSPDPRSKGELLCRPPLDCTDLRPTLYRSTVILSGEQGLARFFRYPLSTRKKRGGRENVKSITG